MFSRSCDSSESRAAVRQSWQYTRDPFLCLFLLTHEKVVQVTIFVRISLSVSLFQGTNSLSVHLLLLGLFLGTM